MAETRSFSFEDGFTDYSLLKETLAPGRNRYYTGLTDRNGNMLAEGSVVRVMGRNGFTGVLLYGDFDNNTGNPIHGYFIIWNSPCIRHDFLYWISKNKDVENEICVIDDIFKYEQPSVVMEPRLLKDIKNAVYYWTWETQSLD